MNGSPYGGGLPALLSLAVLVLFGGLTALLWLGLFGQVARVLLAALEVLMLVLLLQDGRDGDILGFAFGSRFGAPVVGALRLGGVAAVLLVLLAGHLAAWGLLRAAMVVPLGLGLAAAGTGLGLLLDWVEPTPAEVAVRIEALYLAKVPPAMRAELEGEEFWACDPAAGSGTCEEDRTRLREGALERHLGLGWRSEVQRPIGWAELRGRLGR